MTGILEKDKDIASLPRPARTAFALRCAYRTQDLSFAAWPLNQHWSIQVGEALLKIEKAVVDPGNIDHAGIKAAQGDINAAWVAATHSKNKVAAMCFQSASFAADAAMDGDVDNVFATAAILWSAAGQYTGKGEYEEFDQMLAREVDEIKQQCAEGQYTDQTPVSFTSKLWPHGKPSGWPSAARVYGPGLVISVALAQILGISRS